MDFADRLFAYEGGELDDAETVELFQELIDGGQAWLLQGRIGRAAHDLIESGRCSLGPVGFRDYYGGYVPSRDEVEPGTKGSVEYAEARREL